MKKVVEITELGDLIHYVPESCDLPPRISDSCELTVEDCNLIICLIIASEHYTSSEYDGSEESELEIKIRKILEGIK